MDPATASIIVAFIGAVATIIATLITTRSKENDNLPHKKSEVVRQREGATAPLPPLNPDTVFIIFARVIVVLLYLIVGFFAIVTSILPLYGIYIPLFYNAALGVTFLVAVIFIKSRIRRATNRISN